MLPDFLHSSSGGVCTVRYDSLAESLRLRRRGCEGGEVNLDLSDSTPLSRLFVQEFPRTLTLEIEVALVENISRTGNDLVS